MKSIEERVKELADEFVYCDRGTFEVTKTLIDFAKQIQKEQIEVDAKEAEKFGWGKQYKDCPAAW